MALTSILIDNTPTPIATVRPTVAGLRTTEPFVDVQLVNDDPSQTIDVTITRTFATAAEAAPLSDNQFTGMLPGEARVGRISGGNGVQLIFTGQASGAGNASLRYWISS